jgi:hypothetical protein
MTQTNGEGDSESFLDDGKTIGRASRRSSSIYSVPITGLAVQSDSPSNQYGLGDCQETRKSQNQPQALPLITQMGHTSQASHPFAVKPTENTSIHHQNPLAHTDLLSNNPALSTPTTLSGRAHSVEYLSLADALEWKRAHKKPKKYAGNSPLRGADLLSVLKGRDHV